MSNETYGFETRPRRTERFFVLALSINEVRLVDVRPDGVRRVRPKGLPKSMQDALGLDQFDTGLHVHSAGPRTMGRKSRVVHGHGGDDEERRRTSDLRTYLRAVAENARETVGEYPLVLASVAEYFPIFRGVYGGKDLVTGIHGNPDILTDAELADAAGSLIRKRDAEQTAKLLERYRELPDRRRATENPRAILVAAVRGRVETLFVEEGSVLWGSFDPDLERTEIHEEREPGDQDLLDLAVSQTLLHGGDVVTVTAAENPSPGPLAAILRYRNSKAA